MRTADGRNLTYDLWETLGRSIVGGAFENGFPTEAELSRRHGLSRSVTREAVKMLAAKGLVSARPKIGTVVEPSDRWNLLDPDILRWLLERQFSLDLLRQFSELRLAIEPTAAALAGGRDLGVGTSNSFRGRFNFSRSGLLTHCGFARGYRDFGGTHRCDIGPIPAGPK
jgi:DNA-binding FadR family transcriptional regulator